MSFTTSQTALNSSTATLCATINTVPDDDGVLVSASAAGVYVGGTSAVTTSTGFPLPANTPVLIPTSGAAPYTLYAIAGSGTPTLSVIHP
jgi:hypothetical protein